MGASGAALHAGSKRGESPRPPSRLLPAQYSATPSGTPAAPGRCGPGERLTLRRCLAANAAGAAPPRSVAGYSRFAIVFTVPGNGARPALGGLPACPRRRRGNAQDPLPGDRLLPAGP